MAKLKPYYEHYKCTGTKLDNLVLVHGYGHNNYYFDQVTELLLEDYDVFQVELPGFGRSPIHNTPYTLDYVTEQVALIIPNEPCILYGHDLGAITALKIASLFPQKVKKLYVHGLYPKEPSEDISCCGFTNAYFDKLYHWIDEDWQGALIHFLTTSCQATETNTQELSYIKERAFHCGMPAQKALKEGLRIMQHTNINNLISKIDRTINWLCGQQDDCISFNLLTKMLDEYPNTKQLILDTFSYNGLIGQPKTFIQQFKTGLE